MKNYNKKQKLYLVLILIGIIGTIIGLFTNAFMALFYIAWTFFFLHRYKVLSKSSSTDLQTKKINVNSSKKSVPTTLIKKEKFKITGISHYFENTKTLFYENPEYGLTTNELIADQIFYKIYKYDTDIQKVELIPEPDNEFDPNAIKVLFNGVHIGYIKKGSCSRIKNLLKSNKIRGIDGFLCGGKYKKLCEYEDDDARDGYAYQLETDTDENYAYILVYIAENAD